MDIEILLVPDCPNEKPAAESLRAALDSLGLSDTTVTHRLIADQTEAEELGFTGSPTILINGRDPFTEAGRTPGLACRIYQTPEGLAGLPSLDQLRQALSSAV
ncbi:DsbA family protein [Streptomyces sp. CS7]|uniref:DsbA family protein n=1 Tax=Streptomyces TaxID=1883 RepID=UPI0021B4445A|nr:DsbA family protein [Streptomyces sp. CS-7]MCT6782107.1 DsbA family protein [Streptomyces sp. CS-7]